MSSPNHSSIPYSASTHSGSADPTRELLRHTLATLAYRSGKAVRHAPEDFAAFQAGEGVRTPGQILAHMGDLFDWALSIAAGRQKWHDSKPLPWGQEVERFFAALKKFDDFLASTEPVQVPLEKLFQGPVADALSHIGQLAILRRMARAPVKGENYYVADIRREELGLTRPRQNASSDAPRGDLSGCDAVDVSPASFIYNDRVRPNLAASRPLERGVTLWQLAK
jgi:hypothetical protein